MANVSKFYKRLRDLCEDRNMTVNELVQILDLSTGSPTAWKNGTVPRAATIQKIAQYFIVSADYLSGLTDDPIDYENDGDLIASIPSSYLEACDGDVRRAYAMMEAVDEENLGKRALTLTEKGERSSVVGNMNILRIAGRDGAFEERVLTDEQLATVKAFLKLLPDACDDL